MTADLDDLVRRSFSSWKRARGLLGHDDAGEFPVLWFGDLELWRRRKEHGGFGSGIITAAVNPGPSTFVGAQGDRNWYCDADWSDGDAVDAQKYASVLGRYFARIQDRSVDFKWFGNYRKILSALGAGYQSAECPVLHTDVFSPVVTRTRWSGLDRAVRSALMFEGLELWVGLVERLKPRLILISLPKDQRRRVAAHLSLDLGSGQLIYRAEHSSKGKPYKAGPFDIVGYKISTGGLQIPLVFGDKRARTPFSYLNESHLYQAGRRVAAWLSDSNEFSPSAEHYGPFVLSVESLIKTIEVGLEDVRPTSDGPWGMKGGRLLWMREMPALDAVGVPIVLGKEATPSALRCFVELARQPVGLVGWEYRVPVINDRAKHAQAHFPGNGMKHIPGLNVRCRRARL